jgi:hypothetical protein
MSSQEFGSPLCLIQRRSDPVPLRASLLNVHAIGLTRFATKPPHDPNELVCAVSIKLTAVSVSQGDTEQFEAEDRTLRLWEIVHLRLAHCLIKTPPDSNGGNQQSAHREHRCECLVA